jgi:hypothetical protein
LLCAFINNQRQKVNGVCISEQNPQGGVQNFQFSTKASQIQKTTSVCYKRKSKYKTKAKQMGPKEIKYRAKQNCRTDRI